MRAVAVIIVVLGAWAGPLAAQEPASEVDDGRAMFELGRRAYEDRRYDDAVRYFERALEQSGRVELYYNIASAHERNGDREQAIAAFERFIESAPDNDRRHEAEERLRVLREGSTSDHEDEPEPDTTVADGGGSVVGPIVVLALGVAAAGTGALFLGLAGGARSTVEDAPRDTPWVDVEGDASNAETFSLVGAIALGVGGAAMAAGVVWLVASSSSETEVAITPFGVRGAF